MMTQNDPKAAVALIKTEASDPEYLIIERAQNPNDPWSGQLAFPGGHHEAEDKDLLATGIRETFEETGIRLSKINFKKNLPVQLAGRGSNNKVCVAPYLFSLPTRAPTQIDAREVASIFWVKQSHLLNSQNRIKKEIRVMGNRLSFPAININNKALWGFTFMVMQKYLMDEGFDSF